MKFIYLISIAAILLNCSNKKKQELISKHSVNADSVSALPSDTITNVPASDNTEVADEPEGDSLAIAIENAVNTLPGDYLNMSTYYTIASNYSGYENGSESTWYFDQSLKLKYCKGSWDSEGTRESYTYYFDGDDLLASIVEDDYQESSEITILHSGFQPTYGFTRSTDSEGGTTLTYVYESAYNSENAAAKQEFSKLLNLISSNLDSATLTDDEVSIHIENVTNYGMDFTQKEDYSISKKLFDKLIKDR